jgi:hypothetical protein
MHERSLEDWRELLGADRFDGAWTAGYAMAIDEAVAYVRRELLVADRTQAAGRAAEPG